MRDHDPALHAIPFSYCSQIVADSPKTVRSRAVPCRYAARGKGPDSRGLEVQVRGEQDGNRRRALARPRTTSIPTSSREGIRNSTCRPWCADKARVRRALIHRFESGRRLSSLETTEEGLLRPSFPDSEPLCGLCVVGGFSLPESLETSIGLHCSDRQVDRIDKQFCASRAVVPVAPTASAAGPSRTQQRAPPLARPAARACAP